MQDLYFVVRLSFHFCKSLRLRFGQEVQRGIESAMKNKIESLGSMLEWKNCH